MLSFIITFISSFLITPVKAVEPTPTLNPIEEKVRSIVADDDTDNTSISTQPKSFFGSITQIDDTTISININNQNKTLQLNKDITYINDKRQKTKKDNFKVGQTILAMGYLNTDNSLDCRRIVATDNKSVENNNQITTGQIIDVPKSEDSIFAFTPFQNKDIQYQIKFNSSTEFIDTNQKKLKNSDTIAKGKKIIVIMQPDNNNNQTFTAIKIVSLETSTH